MEVDIVEKESHQRAKEEIKRKGISSDPHPKDRESGTGRGKEMRKNGTGKNNWGTYQDDMKDYGVDEDEQEDIKFRAAHQGIVVDDHNFPKLS
ncbi:unnamed protein product (macronuclear) [Paramecium tetraurelia]|uniref:Hyaluronan/mRNA-binding protein domain-containing protein n=1 Tax=Paramecium tetraurelia TaxID=5888 RepID=A0CK33_PARTE|nr:uncharacterized protein GSPATT00000862001 [Paramecium tetraurelia]CAK71150.1 unnamed protein product [Paramecium tetraurelia]|eukprot:XP_001438547.1 hypothetical protein (macronuclear) [Paramecium tetraurelia strain d4-2]